MLRFLLKVMKVRSTCHLCSQLEALKLTILCPSSVVVDCPVLDFAGALDLSGRISTADGGEDFRSFIETSGEVRSPVTNLDPSAFWLNRLYFKNLDPTSGSFSHHNVGCAHDLRVLSTCQGARRLASDLPCDLEEDGGTFLSEGAGGSHPHCLRSSSSSSTLGPTKTGSVRLPYRPSGYRIFTDPCFGCLLVFQPHCGYGPLVHA